LDPELSGALAQLVTQNTYLRTFIITGSYFFSRMCYWRHNCVYTSGISVFFFCICPLSGPGGYDRWTRPLMLTGMDWKDPSRQIHVSIANTSLLLLGFFFFFFCDDRFVQVIQYRDFARITEAFRANLTVTRLVLSLLVSLYPLFTKLKKKNFLLFHSLVEQ
jgi:hypothetical protein